MATTVMTALSYFFSSAFQELYKEPVLLKFLLQRFGSTMSADTEEILAWICHYTVGLFFTLCFHMLFTYGLNDLSWASGALFGLGAGVVGIVWWHIMFRLTRFPTIDLKGYYRQLLFVHIIFGLTITAVYRLILM